VRVRVGAATDIGHVREGNEDAYLLLDPLYAVADGMGGHLGGEVASSLALETIRELFSSGEGSLTEQVGQANRVVFQRSRADREVEGMGTTLTAVVVEGSRVRLAHVGDSRAYLFRDGELQMLTRDHTLVARMVEEGELTEAEATTHPHRSIVTRALGVEETLEVDEGLVEVRDGDRLLLCSDGLTGMVADQDIAAILREVADPQLAVDRLVRAANAAGGVDNITAVILDLSDDGDDAARADRVATDAPTRIPTPVAPPPNPAPRTGEVAGPRVVADARRARPDRRRIVVGVGIALALVVVALVGLRLYLDAQWYVGISSDRVAIFRGVPAAVAGFELHSVVQETEIRADRALALALYRDELPNGITANDRDGAEAIVEQIRRDVQDETGP
jgi:serine/threonine protein phosphatase PrpC